MRDPASILGGESVYCLNRGQLEEAIRLAEMDPVSSPKIRQFLDRTEAQLTRNEQAALAFVLIERLRSTADEAPDE